MIFLKQEQRIDVILPEDIMLGCTSLQITTINLHLTSTHSIFNETKEPTEFTLGPDTVLTISFL
jgi:hypothetical protein